MSCAAMLAERSGGHPRVSEDAMLGGRLVLRQPLKGHRFGHDAILLAAAVDARAGEEAVDLGAGVGAAGLALARRVPGVTVTLLDVDPALIALAQENAERNGLASRVRAVRLDVAAPAAQFGAAGLGASSMTQVLMNPPFDPPRHKASPDRGRRLAHSAVAETLGRFVRAARLLLRPNGVLTLIWRADGLDRVLAALADFGAVAVLPVHAKPKVPAIRVVVRAVKGSRSPLSLLPGFYLADAAGKPTAQAEAVMREAAALPLSAD
jgi:tRNA1(Val) A37 N6-methylase TrmN6